MKQNRAIDLAKLICAVLIIIIHADPFSSYSVALSYGFRNIICTVAVPFFFISSGYIFAEKIKGMQTKEEKMVYYKKYAKRLITMYLCWSVIYFPFVLVRWSRKGFGVSLVLEYIRDFFFEGSYSTIWFLPALIWAITLYYFLSRKFSSKKIFLIAVPFYIFALLGSLYLHLVERFFVLDKVFALYYLLFDTIKNGSLVGFIYVAIGGLFAEEEVFEKIKRLHNVLLIGAFFGFLAIEEVAASYFGWSYGCDNAIFLVPLSFLIFRFVLNTNLKEHGFYIMLRKLSLLMFLCQRIPLSIIELFMSETLIYQNSAVHFAVVLSTTLLFSLAIIGLTKKVKVLKYFY